MTVAEAPTSVTTASNRSSFSRSVTVGPSPVVPHTTMPSDPVSTRWWASRRAESRFRDPSAANGVTIAVSRDPRPVCTAGVYPRLPLASCGDVRACRGDQRSRDLRGGRRPRAARAPRLRPRRGGRPVLRAGRRRLRRGAHAHRGGGPRGTRGRYRDPALGRRLAPPGTDPRDRSERARRARVHGRLRAVPGRRALRTVRPLQSVTQDGVLKGLVHRGG